MANLVRVAPGALTVGKPLPWTVYDSEGNVLLRQGYVIQSVTQLEQLFERGLFQPRMVKKPEEKPEHEDRRARNPFAEYPALLQTLEATLTAITEKEPSAQKRLFGLIRIIDQMCDDSPDASLALVHLYSVEPTIFEQIIFYAILCRFMARRFGIEENRIQVLIGAALTANLGLVPVADKLNASNQILNDDQRAVIRKHPQRSIQALKEAGINNSLLLKIIDQHHEHADGSGYPEGLSGTDIVPEAEMIALAERYVAMITQRAYRSRMSVLNAGKKLISLGGETAREAIARALSKELTQYPPGSLVKLANGDVAVITARPRHARGPFAKAILNPRGERYSGPFDRDCSEVDYLIVDVEQPEIMPSMDFGLIWGFR